MMAPRVAAFALAALALTSCRTTGLDAVGAGYARGQQGYYYAPPLLPPPPRQTTCRTIGDITRCTSY